MCVISYFCSTGNRLAGVTDVIRLNIMSAFFTLVSWLTVLGSILIKRRSFLGFQTAANLDGSSECEQHQTSPSTQTEAKAVNQEEEEEYAKDAMLCMQDIRPTFSAASTAIEAVTSFVARLVRDVNGFGVAKDLENGVDTVERRYSTLAELYKDVAPDARDLCNAANRFIKETRTVSERLSRLYSFDNGR
mmetsp:Transcript_3316/g.5027  ORF Transcript_3316/g.5027 Transcript_3316/m.5027 type:complete len:190 (-) Transcript_3316:88-657(-)